MLVEFRLSNFKSIRHEQTLSLIAGSGDELRGHLIKTNRHDLLKSVGLYGANASGKTNILEGLYAMRRIVIETDADRRPGSPLPGIDPFRLDSKNRKEPCRFEIEVNLFGDLYRYGFAATAERVIDEKLELRRAGTSTSYVTLIDRKFDRHRGEYKIKLHEKLMGSKAHRAIVREQTRDDQLMLSRAFERNTKSVMPLFDWFSISITFLDLHRSVIGQSNILKWAALWMNKDEECRQKLARLLASADTGIIDLFSRRENENQKSLFPDFESGHYRIQAMHQSIDTGETVPFELESESSGTRRFLAIAAILLAATESPGLIVIDELDSGLHPELARRILQMIHGRRYNPKGAQLLFTTHDTNLMDARTTLRRDQIWVCEKDCDGCTELYSFADIKPIPRDDSALAKQYLQGRFGGVPEFGPELEDIFQDDQPLPLFD